MEERFPSLAIQEKSSFRERLLFFLFPPKCTVCGEMGYGLLCPRCEEELKEAFLPERFLASGGNGYADSMTSLFPYEAYAPKKLLLLWKRLDHPRLSAIFLPYIQKWQRKQLSLKDPVITYLPRRKAAKWKMGFDQAEKIALLVSRSMNSPLKTLLIRQGYSKSQHSLPTEKRQANVAGAFRPVRALAGETVLLIDDIVTSGASAKEAARVLKKAGAQKVFVLCLAR